MKKTLFLAAAAVLVVLLGSCDLGGEVIILGATYSSSNPDAALYFEEADAGVLTEPDAYGNEVETNFDYTYDTAERSGRIDFPDGSVMKFAEFSISSDGEVLEMPWPAGGTTQTASLYLEE